MLSQTALPARVARGPSSSRLSAATFPHTRSTQKRTVIVRFKESDHENVDALKQELEQQLQQDAQAQDLKQQPLQPLFAPSEPKLSPQQYKEVITKEPGNISPRLAEMRADMGTAVNDISIMQTFDGPAPETINGRLAMLGVVAGLAGEYFTGLGLQQQTADHPATVLASFVLMSVATYAPLVKGYTRKEPFANTFLGLNWSPKAENWNGRLAMLGFSGMILTEALSGLNTLQAWGLQPTNFTGFH
ncbi:hypothetical protein OEZ85_007223 [Tetradesmus obliquus]|uniref:Uncharacterized protein n=1 Tax=Tetradesmus obliquus TaxID=3088 RepID=A0ABY8TX12_TETOB|nr:hypothetical protein OEZ85_007223 [Tetradesmus obliquus]